MEKETIKKRFEELTGKPVPENWETSIKFSLPDIIWMFGKDSAFDKLIEALEIIYSQNKRIEEMEDQIRLIKISRIGQKQSNSR